MKARLLAFSTLLIMQTSATVFADEALPTATIGGPAWCRLIFQLPKTIDTGDANLLIATEGVASVYLNGQRLARQQEADNKVMAWKVGALLRQGRNSLAVAITADKGSLTAAFEQNAKVSAIAGTWKTVATAPPVGWQTTDFNDRDWKALPTPAAESPFGNRQRQEIDWRKTSDQQRIFAGQLKFANNDHVVMLGGTFFERAQQFGHLEAALNIAAGRHKVTFRNLGWSGDTVYADSRGIFDSPERGYERMIEHVRAEEPDVILVNYGQNEAMTFSAAKTTPESFRKQLGQLHRDLSATGADIVYLTPHPFVSARPPLPDASRWNDKLLEYAGIVHEFAASVQSPAIGLFDGFIEDMSLHEANRNPSGSALKDLSDHPDLLYVRNERWTDNGMHWNAEGYRCVGPVVAFRTTGAANENPTITVDATAQQVVAIDGEIRNVNWASNGKLTFEYRQSQISPAPVTIRLATGTTYESCRIGAGDTSVRATLMTDDAGRSFVSENTQYERLVELTVRKNEQYFHRWRPQNITYLYGFRKHEQGNNASEIAQFDPIVQDLESQIHKAKQATWQTITLSRRSE